MTHQSYKGAEPVDPIFRMAPVAGGSVVYHILGEATVPCVVQYAPSIHQYVFELVSDPQWRPCGPASYDAKVEDIVRTT